MRERLLDTLARLVIARPRIVVLLALLLSIAGAVFAWQRLELNSDTNALIGRDQPYMQEYQQFIDEFGELEFALIIVDPQQDDASARGAVDALALRLHTIAGLNAVHAFIDSDAQLDVALHTMPDADLRELSQTREGLPVLLAPDATAGDVVQAANDQLDRVQQLLRRSPGSQPVQGFASGAIFLLETLVSANAASAEQAFTVPEREYFTTPSGDLYLIRIDPAADYATLAAIEAPLAAIREAIDQTRIEFPGVDIGLTGKPVLQADELSTSARDMTRASIVAVILVTIIFMIAFRGIRRPLMAVAALGCGMAWTFGMATVIIEQLNLLSIVFAIILVGVGIDFGIHLVSRYQEYLARYEGDRGAAVRSAMVTAGVGNLTGAVTSSLAFFGTMLGSFQGLRELGLIAGIGLLLCLVAMLTVLPALLVWLDSPATGPSSDRPIWIDTLGARMQSRPLMICGVAVLITIAAGFMLPRLTFEENLLELQAVDLDSVQWEHRLLDDGADTVWFAAAIADNREELEAMQQRAAAEDAIAATHSILDVLPPPSTVRRSTLQYLVAARETSLNLAHPPLNADMLAVATEHVDTMADLAARYEPDHADRLTQLADNLRGMSTRFALDDTTESILTEHVREQGDLFRQLLRTADHPSIDVLPAAVRDVYISSAGRFILMMHPADNIWQADAMRDFIDAARRVDPDVTGTPITHYESLQDMHDAFRIAAIAAFIMVAIVLLIDFRSPRCAVLALLPLAFGLVWLGAIMALTGVSFNLANFFAVPVLIGLGVDNGVHLIHRARERGGGAGFGATGRAVVVTSITTMTGFGCMMLATHRGLFSLGLVMTLGVLTCLIASIVVLPAAIRLLLPSQTAPRIDA